MDRKNIFDTWVMTDALGRLTPDPKQVGAPNGKEVGIFYFMWHDIKDGPIFDHYQAYQDGGMEAVWKMSQEGRLGYAHFWGQPYFGYYQADDEWIISKHCRMLAASGIDFIFFDTSNGHYYPQIYPKVFETFLKIKSQGIKVPKIFFFNGDIPELNKRNILGEYEDVYSKGLYKELWYMVDGKPLMLGNPELIEDKELLSFFTIRKSWAFSAWEWYKEREGKNCWPWIDHTPQKPGLSPDGKIEQCIVSCGFHSNGSDGRSFHNGKQPTEGLRDFGFSMTDTLSPHGLAFEEQFNRAKEIDAPRMMITGWNEWWAGRWDGPAAQGQTICKTYKVDINSPDKRVHNHYVDNFSPEFSRDIEPMKGGFGDNYYCQMVQYNWEYKGINPNPASSGRGTIDINGTVAQWENILPEYLDFIGDVEHRDYDSFGGVYHYVNTTGRNDLNTAKVVRDDKYLYFLITTTDKLTSPEGTNWMNLLIDTNPGWRDGWEGYSFMINRQRDGSKASVQKSDGGWNWGKIGDADITIGANYVVLKVESAMLGLSGEKIAFDFKWADNSVSDGDIMGFYDKGDAAPDGRFNFRYVE